MPSFLLPGCEREKERWRDKNGKGQRDRMRKNDQKDILNEIDTEKRKRYNEKHIGT
jgi:hypothetical protein